MTIKINKFYQLLFDYAFGIKKSSVPKIKGVANKIYMYQVNNHRRNHNDTIFIDYKSGVNSMTLSTTHNLPFTLKRHKLYSMNLVRLCKYIAAKKRNLKIIDIGANIGDTVFLISREGNFPILCIEGNPEYLDLLKHNIAKYDKVELADCFVGSEDKIENGKIVSDGLGTSFIKIENSENKISYKSLPSIVKEHPNFSDFNLLKIDTDGFDGEIIRGNMEYIAKNKPVIFFEYAPMYFQNGMDSELILFKTLTDNQYNKLIFYNNFGEIIFVYSTFDEIGINAAHEYFCRDNRYADVIAFHQTDNKLFEYVLQNENSYMKDFYQSKVAKHD